MLSLSLEWRKDITVFAIASDLAPDTLSKMDFQALITSVEARLRSP